MLYLEENAVACDSYSAPVIVSSTRDADVCVLDKNNDSSMYSHRALGALC